MLAAAAQNLLLAAEEERTGLDLVLPDAAELIGGALAFLVVFALLGKFVWPRISEAIQKREQTIQAQAEEAEQARSEAKRILDEYHGKIAEARSESNRILEEARQSAEEVRKDLIEKAKAEAAQTVERAQEQIEAERLRTIQELQAQVADMSIELAEKVIGRSLDAPAQRQLVDAYIKEVSGMQSTNGGGR